MNFLWKGLNLWDRWLLTILFCSVVLLLQSTLSFHPSLQVTTMSEISRSQIQIRSRWIKNRPLAVTVSFLRISQFPFPALVSSSAVDWRRWSNDQHGWVSEAVSDVFQIEKYKYVPERRGSDSGHRCSPFLQLYWLGCKRVGPFCGWVEACAGGTINDQKGKENGVPVSPKSWNRPFSPLKSKRAQSGWEHVFFNWNASHRGIKFCHLPKDTGSDAAAVYANTHGQVHCIVA